MKGGISKACGAGPKGPGLTEAGSETRDAEELCNFPMSRSPIYHGLGCSADGSSCICHNHV